MRFASTDDGVRIYFEETGSGVPGILVHQARRDSQLPPMGPECRLMAQPSSEHQRQRLARPRRDEVVYSWNPLLEFE